MPEELKTRISDAAAIAGRSLHAELLFRLGASLEHNKNESELLGAKLRRQEAELETMKVKHEVIDLANVVLFLLAMIESREWKPEDEDREMMDFAAELAQEKLRYQTQLNPELLLEEYRQTFDEAKKMLKFWAPGYYPWPGRELAEAAKRSKRSRKSKSNP